MVDNWVCLIGNGLIVVGCKGDILIGCFGIDDCQEIVVVYKRFVLFWMNYLVGFDGLFLSIVQIFCFFKGFMCYVIWVDYQVVGFVSFGKIGWVGCSDDFCI